MNEYIEAPQRFSITLDLSGNLTHPQIEAKWAKDAADREAAGLPKAIYLTMKLS